MEAFLGFTAQQTLDYTQSLYEKKLVTYPRTDSRFLTEDMGSMIPDLAGKMVAKFGYTRKMVIHPKEVINNSKVSDHHAIIPTVNVADLLIMSGCKSDEEREFYIRLCIKEKYSKRQLQRQMDSGYYERYMLSKDTLLPESVKKLGENPFLRFIM